MALGILVLVAWMALELVVILAAIGWGFQTGQWKDIEEPKYRMLLDLPMEPWPGREKSEASPETGESSADKGTRR